MSINKMIIIQQNIAIKTACIYLFFIENKYDSKIDYL
jgi:hypothetical protein